MDKAAIIAKHYGIDKIKVTTDDVTREIANLQRRHADGTLDDHDADLYYSLRLDSKAGE